MKTIPAGLMTEYESGSSTITTCWKVTLTNSTVLGFTECDVDLTIDGLTYLAATGFSPSTFQGQTKLAVDNADAVGIIDSTTISAEDLAAGIWDYAQVEVFQVDRTNIAAGQNLITKGHLGQIGIERGTFKAELRGLTNNLVQSVGKIYSPSCRANLGDSKCGVDLGPFTVTGTLTGVSADGLVLLDTGRTEPGPAGALNITSVSSAANAVVGCTGHPFQVGQVVYITGVVGPTKINGQYWQIKSKATNNFTIAFNSTSEPAYSSGGKVSPQGDAGYFAYGKITMTSGTSNGLSMEVKAYGVGTVSLQLQFPLGVAAGDTYTMHAGCGKRFTEDCVGRFSNGANFRGEPHMPGMDQVTQIGGR